MLFYFLHTYPDLVEWNSTHLIVRVVVEARVMVELGCGHGARFRVGSKVTVEPGSGLSQIQI